MPDYSLLLAEIVNAINNQNPISADALLTLLKTVDGEGSGLDADLLRGLTDDQIRNPDIRSDEGYSVGVKRSATVRLDVESWGRSAAVLFNAYRIHPRPNGGWILADGNTAFAGNNYQNTTAPGAIGFYGNNDGMFELKVGPTNLQPGDPITWTNLLTVKPKKFLYAGSLGGIQYWEGNITNGTTTVQTDISGAMGHIIARAVPGSGVPTVYRTDFTFPTTNGVNPNTQSIQVVDGCAGDCGIMTLEFDPQAYTLSLKLVGEVTGYSWDVSMFYTYTNKP